MKLLRLSQENYNSLENVKELLDTLIKEVKGDSTKEVVNYDTMKPIDLEALQIALRYLKRNFG